MDVACDVFCSDFFATSFACNKRRKVLSGLHWSYEILTERFTVNQSLFSVFTLCSGLFKISSVEFQLFFKDHFILKYYPANYHKFPLTGFIEIDAFRGKPPNTQFQFLLTAHALHLTCSLTA